MRTYCKYVCPICAKVISSAGVSTSAHGRMHVRRGEAYEIGYDHPDYRGVNEFVLEDPRRIKPK